MLFWKIALQVLAVAIALLVNTLDYVTYDKRTRKFKKGRMSLFLFSGLFLLGCCSKWELFRANKIAANEWLLEDCVPGVFWE